jgi:hypothetical protein
MAWGDFLQLGAQLLGGDVGKVVAGVGTAINTYDAFKRQQQSEQNIDRSIAQQAGLSSATAQNALRIAQQNAAIRNRIMQLTDQLGATLRQTQADLGPAYVPNKADVEADYGRIYSRAKDEYMTLASAYGAKQQADNLRRYAGGRNPALESFQEQLFMREYGPQLEDIRNRSFAEALTRQKGYVDLLNSGRATARTEATAAITPQLQSYLNLLQQTGDGTSAAQTASGIGTTLREAEAARGEGSSAQMAELIPAIQDIFGTGTQPVQQEEIIWNTPRIQPQDYRTPGINPSAGQDVTQRGYYG